MPEVKERVDVSSVGEEKKIPAVELATEMYKNITMGSDALLHLLPKINDKSRHAASLKTDMTASMCFYEKMAGRVKSVLTSHHAEAKEESWMNRTMARMGIAMNTAMDDTDSHIAQMLIEGSTMSVTEMTRLVHRFGKQKDCDELVDMANEIVTFEQGQIERMKQYL
jgi:hypothetical protein